MAKRKQKLTGSSIIMANGTTMQTWDYLTDTKNWFMVDSKYMTLNTDRWIWKGVSWDEVDPPPETEMQKAIREAVGMLK